ncbi:MAG: ElyC/SanA/YdcF family protein [Gemmatimonadota bacterium]
MFWLKKLAGTLLSPFLVAIGLLVVGVVLVWWRRGERVGRWMVVVGLTLMVALSYGFPTQLLLTRLESEYPPLVNPGDFPEVEWIVVLGGGHITNVGTPVTNWIGNSSLRRLTEGIRLYRLMADARIVVSGAAIGDPTAHAQVASEVLQALGVPEEDIVVEPRPRATAEEARYIQETLEGVPFFLVTSASHMPRAVMLFTSIGMRPIPAPAQIRAAERPQFDIRYFVPSPVRLLEAHEVTHEVLGIVWAWLRGARERPIEGVGSLDGTG